MSIDQALNGNSDEDAKENCAVTVGRPNSDGIGPRLDLLAQELGVSSDRALASRLKIAPATVANLRHGERVPLRSTLLAVATAAGVRLDWLMTGEGPMRDPEPRLGFREHEAAAQYNPKPSPPDEWDHANLAWALEFAEKQIGPDAPAAQRSDLMLSVAREFRRVQRMPPLPDFNLDLLARSLDMAEAPMRLGGRQISDADRIRRTLRIYAIANGDDEDEAS